MVVSRAADAGGSWIELYHDRDHGEDDGYCWRDSDGDGDTMRDDDDTFARALAVVERMAHSRIGRGIPCEVIVAESALAQCEEWEGYRPDGYESAPTCAEIDAEVSP